SLIQLFTYHRQAEPETQEICRAAEIFQTTLKLLKERVKQSYKRNVTLPGRFAFLYYIQKISPWMKLDTMEKQMMLHSVISCTLLHCSIFGHTFMILFVRQNPRWGAANTALVRWLPAEYDDGENEPKGWNRQMLHNGFHLPSPRKVSQEVIRTSCKETDTHYTQLLVEWGQYIDHDITFTPQTSGSTSYGTDCLDICKNVHPCYPIETEDEHCGEHGCMSFFRSLPDCHVQLGCDIRQALQRQQINGLSSFIDASVVYGNTPKLQSFLRDLCGLDGKLAVNTQFRDPRGRPYLPFVAKLPSACIQNPQDPQGERVDCFSAGDSRVNEGLPLTSLHTLFLREHNRIAEALKHINSHWSPEMIYQETRKIMGAQHQIITMRDYVPKILGPDSFHQYIGPYKGYDPTVDPSAANVFSTAAFRFGHGTISPVVRRLNESFQEHELYPSLRLHSTFFSPWRIIEGGIESVLRGIIGSKASAVKAKTLMTEEVTERLVVLKAPQRMDLAALNMQRGRDHGLPGYNKWREFCGLKRIRTLDDLKEVVGDNTVAEKILNLYKHLDNIDVWLGGLVEKVLPGSRTGPLFACLIGRQMKALRDGDRFWWNAEGVFTQQQKTELLKISMSRLICDNTDIKEVPYDCFIYGEYPSDYVHCDSVPSVNLEAWREEENLHVWKLGKNVNSLRDLY
uniref:Thyroid peroxidase n=1 Tax=Amphiprion percula TaxID=161767 RepID=A0A3P8TL30_AMPPE